MTYIKFILAFTMMCGWALSAIYLFIKAWDSNHHILFGLMAVSTLALPLVLAYGED
jgi:hypothetical protein